MTRLRGFLPPLAVILACAGTSLSLRSLVVGNWQVSAVIAVVAVVAGNELARRVRAPRALVPFGGVVALAIVLVARFAGEQAVFGVVPTGAALNRLIDLISAGEDEIARSVAPVTAGPGIALLVVLGVGLVTLAVHTRAVVYGGAGLAAIPLLGLYAVPALVSPDGAAPVGFLLGACGYLLLLYLDRQERLSGWGRVVGLHPEDSEAPRRPLGRPSAPALGFGIVAPVVVALLLPAAVPALSTGLLNKGEDRAARNRTVHVVNPILNLQDDLLRRDNRALMTYRSSTGKGAYIRVVGLDQFTGDRWDASRLQVRQTQKVNEGLELTGVGPEIPRVEGTLEMQVGPLATQWLPLPYPATRVEIDDSWLYDKDTFNVFSTERSTQNSTYTVSWSDLQPTADQLRDAPPPPDDLDARYLALPDDLPSVIRERTDEFTAGADNPYDQAKAIEGRLREFDYDERAPNGTGSLALAAFFRSRSGFCVHFASAMAVMARQLGIPARVAVGFLPNASSRLGDGRFVVTSHDAHAWPELYFSGAGWVRFEPTPGPQVPPSAQSPAPTEPTAEPSAEPSPEPSAEPEPESSPTPTPAPQAQTPPPAAGGDSSWGAWAGGLVGALAVVGLLGAPALARVLLRRRRWRRAGEGPVHLAAAASEQLRVDCRDFGVPWREYETPRQFGARLAQLLGSGPAGTAALRLTQLTERLRYSPEVGEVSGVRHDLVLVRDGLASNATARTRVEALWFPPSVRQVAREWLRRVGQRMSAVRGRLRPSPES